MESPQSQPSAPAVQVLKQRLLQIVEVQRALQERYDERSREVESAVAAFQNVSCQGNQMVEDGDKLRQERDQLRQERDQLLQERDQLRLNNNNLASHHQNLSEQFDVLQQEHNSLCNHLRQHSLLEEMSNNNGSLSEALEQLLSERQKLAENCRESNAECEKLKRDLQKFTKKYRDTFQALIHIFPKEIYLAKRPDLDFLTDINKLLEHFINHGIHEGVNLDYATLHDEMVTQATEANNTLQAKLNELEVLVGDSSKRLSFIHDLFVRLSLEGHVK